jgi:excisionase family DNA binding protein
MDEEEPLVPFESRWDVKDVAAFLKCSRSWVYKAAEKGWLPYRRCGSLLRFDPEAIRAFGKSAAPAAFRPRAPRAPRPVTTSTDQLRGGRADDSIVTEAGGR